MPNSVVVLEEARQQLDSQHYCVKSDEFQRIDRLLNQTNKSLTSWKNIRFFAILSAFAVLLGGALFLFSVKSDYALISTRMGNIEEDISEVKQSTKLNVQKGDIEDLLGALGKTRSMLESRTCSEEEPNP